MANSYLWYNPSIEPIEFDPGAVTGIHYSDAMSTLNNYDGTKSVAQWEGVLVPLYLQIKVHPSCREDRDDTNRRAYR